MSKCRLLCLNKFVEYCLTSILEKLIVCLSLRSSPVKTRRHSCHASIDFPRFPKGDSINNHYPDLSITTLHPDSDSTFFLPVVTLLRFRVRRTCRCTSVRIPCATNLLLRNVFASLLGFPAWSSTYCAPSKVRQLGVVLGCSSRKILISDSHGQTQSSCQT